MSKYAVSRCIASVDYTYSELQHIHPMKRKSLIEKKENMSQVYTIFRQKANDLYDLYVLEEKIERDDGYSLGDRSRLQRSYMEKKYCRQDIVAAFEQSYQDFDTAVVAFKESWKVLYN